MNETTRKLITTERDKLANEIVLLQGQIDQKTNELAELKLRQAGFKSRIADLTLTLNEVK